MFTFERIFTQLELVFDKELDVKSVLSVYGKILINSFAIQDAYFRPIARGVYLGWVWEMQMLESAKHASLFARRGKRHACRWVTDIFYSLSPSLLSLPLWFMCSQGLHLRPLVCTECSIFFSRNSNNHRFNQRNQWTIIYWVNSFYQLSRWNGDYK